MRLLHAFLGLALLLPFGMASTAGAQASGEKSLSGNPVPAEGDLVIPGPGGVVFAFRPVSIRGAGGEEQGPLSGVRFIMGDPAGDFRSPPTAVVIGGAFESDAETPDKEGWTYYLGKYEITRAQYAAVMGEEALPAVRGQDAPDMPVTGVSFFDAMRFVDALNTWLYANAMDSLPCSGPFPAFVRLPTEAEWEFAARGGQKVEAVAFDASHPYGDDLAAHEWFSGPNSSHNKVQPVGKLRPNPLGLHDMLGNVREMTLSQYHIEYYQGRSGGFAARGGHFLVAEKDMACALRTEEPYYLGSADKGMRPNVKPTMGLRLVLSAPVLTDRDSIAAIEDAWETHRSGAGADLPAALSVADVAAQEAVPARDALEKLEKVKGILRKEGLLPNLEKDIAAAENALQQIARIRRQADQDSARVWVKIAAERGLYLSINLRGLALALEAPTEKLRARAEQFAYNVSSGLDSYSEIMTELGKLPKEAVEGAFDAHSAYLAGLIEKERASKDKEAEKRIEDITRQKDQWLPVTRKHYERYGKEKRFDAAAWRSDYAVEN